jgi:hypothetical protein
MSKEEINFDDFLLNVSFENMEFAREMHDNMLQNNCSYKIETAKNGHVLSYVMPKTKKVIVNYVFRKNGMVIRIYGDNIGKYADILTTLPDNMVKAIEKAPVCKRLVDPTKCNSRCPMGNIFTLDGKEYKNCRYSSFMFEVKEENHKAIREFVARERESRM